MLQAIVDLRSISPHPRNPRRDVGDVTDLAASIAAVGLLEPLVVAPWPADLGPTPDPTCPTCGATGKCRTPAGATAKAWHAARQAVYDAGVRVEYVAICGHRRLAAVLTAGATDVPVVVRDDLTTTSAQLEAMLVENLHRADLTPIEEARAYQALLDLDFTQVAVAAATAQPKGRIRDRLKLLKLPEAAQARVHDGQVTLADALALADFVDDPEYAGLGKKIGTGEFTWALSRAREARKARRDLDRRVGEYRNRTWQILTDKKAPAGSAQLRTVLTGYQSYGMTPAEKDAWAHGHDECPGRAIRLTGFSNDPLEWLCLTPDAHATDDDAATPAGDAAPVDEEAAERARAEAQAELELDRAAATELRRAFLVGLLDAATDEQLHRLLVDHLLAAAKVEMQNGLIRELLSVDQLTEEVLAPRSIRALTLLAMLTATPLRAYSAEHWIRRHNARTLPAYQTERVYLEQLRDVLGYTLTPFEEQLLETPPEPEPDEDLEGDDLQDDEDFAYDDDEDLDEGALDE